MTNHTVRAGSVTRGLSIEAAARQVEARIDADLDNNFDGILPDELPAGFNLLKLIQAAVQSVLTVAGAAASQTATTVSATIGVERITELETAPHPFDSPLLAAALQGGLRLGQASSRETFDEAIKSEGSSKSLKTAIQNLEKRSRRRVQVGQGRIRAHQEVRRHIDDIRERFRAMLHEHGCGLLGEAICRDLQTRIENTRRSQEAVTTLHADASDRSPNTRFGRGRTTTDHRFSVAPSTDVLLTFVARRAPEVIAANGGPQETTFWPRFSTWLSRGGWPAPDRGPEETIRAVREFLADTAKELVPVEVGLGELYEGAEMPFEVDRWAVLAAPRVRVGSGAEPIRIVRAIEAPGDLPDELRRQLATTGDADIRPGTLRNRIRFAVAAHGFTLSEMLRGDFGTLGRPVIEELAEAASTPQLERAIRERLPARLYEKPKSVREPDATEETVPATSIALENGDRSNPDGHGVGAR